MLSKNKIKYFCSFHNKKQRVEYNLFIVEGNKMVEELIHSDYKITSIVATSEWILKHSDYNFTCEVIDATVEDLQKISLLQNPQEVWALVECKSQEKTFSIGENELILALDGIQDPGNLGTIIRIADWYGISQIWCSEDTVDVYNPKVIQATMGAVFRVAISYGSLIEKLQKCTSIPIYAALLDGTNVYSTELSQKAILIMGNEGNGISKNVIQHINYGIHIPSFNESEKSSESLNVAVATGILCSEFKRRKG
jgi:RNA methyltransferase, TrmH family